MLWERALYISIIGKKNTSILSTKKTKIIMLLSYVTSNVLVDLHVLLHLLKKKNYEESVINNSIL